MPVGRLFLLIMTADQLALEIFLHDWFVVHQHDVLGTWDPFQHAQRQAAAEYGLEQGWLDRCLIYPKADRPTSSVYTGSGAPPERWYYLTDVGKERFFNRKS